jgi:hypothetical protein
MASTEINLTKAASKVDLPGAKGGGDFGEWLSGLMSVVMVFAAILVLLYLIWGAMEWITSGGDKSKVEAARTKITNAIVGLLVLSATTGLFIILQQFLGICVLSIAGSC